MGSVDFRLVEMMGGGAGSESEQIFERECLAFVSEKYVQLYATVSQCAICTHYHFHNKKNTAKCCANFCGGLELSLVELVFYN